jgi:hypothetical protein
VVSAGTALGTAAAHRALTIQPFHEACPHRPRPRIVSRHGFGSSCPIAGNASRYCIARKALLRPGSPDPLISENGRHTSKSQAVPPQIGQRRGSFDAAAP